jgi:hypothetical protein
MCTVAPRNAIELREKCSVAVQWNESGRTGGSGGNEDGAALEAIA